jgi:hypothetical protein
MAGKAPGYRDILTRLLSDQNASEAIRLTIERDRDNAYSFAKYCLSKIVGDDNNRRPDYLLRVRYFQHVHFSPQDPEWDQLQLLMEGSLRAQYRAETSRKPFFRGRPDLDADLRQIKCLPHAVYEYRIPEELVEEAKERERERREELHSNPVNISDIQTIISRALAWRERSDPWEWVACASVLCGRRTQEILHAADFTPVDRYIVQVSGLLKQGKGEGKIPVVGDTDDFMALMEKIRENNLPSYNHSNRFKPAFVRVFGGWYNHTQRRNIYCEATYRCRDISGFYPDAPRIIWFDRALCHDSNVIHQAPSLCYQTLTFHERDVGGAVPSPDRLSP